MSGQDTQEIGEPHGTAGDAGALKGPARLIPYFRSPLKTLSKVLERECEGVLLIRGIGCTCDVSARVFSIEINEEEGIAVLICRRCRKEILAYDRLLAWGIRRECNAGRPRVFPYKCTCGGHAFQVAVGMEYPCDPVGDDDMLQFSIAASCLACDEVSVAFDDEGD